MTSVLMTRLNGFKCFVTKTRPTLATGASKMINLQY